MEIKVMARRGVSIREMAKQLGSRNTIRQYLHEADAQQYKPREARATKLDPLKDYLRRQIEAARPHWIPAAVLLRESQDLGYPGGVTQLKKFLSGYKCREPEPVVRFETPPSEQMRHPYPAWPRSLARLCGHAGYSRSSWVRFTKDERADTWFGCLRQAFIYFGGVPRHVLFDNAGAIIIERNAYGAGHHRWHSGLLAVAEEFGFTPRVCQPYRAQTKGKVERFNGYLKGSFCVPLAATVKQAGLRFDVDAANAHVGRWLTQVADNRIHGTTRERPAKRLGAKRLVLLPLPEQHYGLVLPALTHRPVPIESFQHPLSVYNELLEVQA